jgi:hypothetical protein
MPAQRSVALRRVEPGHRHRALLNLTVESRQVTSRRTGLARRKRFRRQRYNHASSRATPEYTACASVCQSLRRGKCAQKSVYFGNSRSLEDFPATARFSRFRPATRAVSDWPGSRGHRCRCLGRYLERCRGGRCRAGPRRVGRMVAANGPSPARSRADWPAQRRGTAATRCPELAIVGFAGSRIAGNRAPPGLAATSRPLEPTRPAPNPDTTEAAGHERWTSWEPFLRSPPGKPDSVDE